MVETPKKSKRGKQNNYYKQNFKIIYLSECIFKKGNIPNNQWGFLPSACLRPCGLEICSLVRKGKAVCKISGVFFPGKGERTKAEIYDIHFMPYKENIHLSICLSVYLSIYLSTYMYRDPYVSSCHWIDLEAGISFIYCSEDSKFNTWLEPRELDFLICFALSHSLFSIFWSYAWYFISNNRSDYLETEQCQSRR